MEGCDRAQGGKIKEKNPIIERDLIIEKRKNIIALRTVIVTKSKRNIYIYIQELLSSDMVDEEFLCTTCFFIVFLAFSLSLVHCKHCSIL